MDQSTPHDYPVVIITGGDAIDPAVVSSLPTGALTIAADSGLDLARSLGLVVDVVVGDMDSVDPATLEQARRSGARVDVHPVDKDATDLELAIDVAIDSGATRLVLLGGRGGRIAHLLGNALVLAAPRLASVPLEWRFAATSVQPAWPQRGARLSGAAGDVVSILPIGGPATGVTTSGLRWALSGETLDTGSTRGISNEMTQPDARVSLRTGVVLVVHERKT